MPFEEYFWRLKSFFPGDPEFTWEKYSSLPYAYVINAYLKGANLYREQMHDRERPIALNSSILANQNRDPKKGKPATWEDYSFYKPRFGEDAASYVYGSSMIHLINNRRLPSWALFCFKEVSANAVESYKPEMAGFIAEDALLLHPVDTGNGWEGMLIAQESASNQYRLFTDDEGNTHKLLVPFVHTKVVCSEGVILTP